MPKHTHLDRATTAVADPFAAEPPGMRIAAGLARLSLALRQRSWREAGELGLTPTQGQILELLASRGEASLGEIAAQLGLRPATTSEAVSTLVAKGWVRKERSSTDRRRLSLRLTPAGENRAGSVASFSAFLALAAEKLEPAEQGRFLRLLVKMIRSLQEAGEIPVAHMCVTCAFFRPHVYADAERPHHCAFVDASFGDRHLRLECSDHQGAEPSITAATWRRFSTAEV